MAYEAPESSSVESGVESGSVETAGHGSSRVTSHFLNISLFGMRILASAYIAVQHPKNDIIEVKSFWQSEVQSSSMKLQEETCGISPEITPS